MIIGIFYNIMSMLSLGGAMVIVAIIGLLKSLGLI